MTIPLTLDSLKAIIGLIAIAFATFFFLDGRHAHHYDVEGTDASLRERILMSESTRYAEIQKYYVDKMASGETLTDAELARLRLVQKQQERIAEVLGK
jgi:hypothetical protein